MSETVLLALITAFGKLFTDLVATGLDTNPAATREILKTLKEETDLLVSQWDNAAVFDKED